MVGFKKKKTKVPIMAAATSHLEGTTPLYSKASILDPTVATQATGKSYKERKGKLNLLKWGEAGLSNTTGNKKRLIKTRPRCSRAL